jgi:hypothetical protein
MKNLVEPSDGRRQTLLETVRDFLIQLFDHGASVSHGLTI